MTIKTAEGANAPRRRASNAHTNQTRTSTTPVVLCMPNLSGGDRSSEPQPLVAEQPATSPPEQLSQEPAAPTPAACAPPAPSTDNFPVVDIPVPLESASVQPEETASVVPSVSDSPSSLDSPSSPSDSPIPTAKKRKRRSSSKKQTSSFGSSKTEDPSLKTLLIQRIGATLAALLVIAMVAQFFTGGGDDQQVVDEAPTFTPPPLEPSDFAQSGDTTGLPTGIQVPVAPSTLTAADPSLHEKQFTPPSTPIIPTDVTTPLEIASEPTERKSNIPKIVPPIEEPKQNATVSQQEELPRVIPPTPYPSTARENWGVFDVRQATRTTTAPAPTNNPRTQPNQPHADAGQQHGHSRFHIERR